jgi:uncharacterized protein
VILFEWDDRKAARNIREHGVSFDEAETVFDDEHALLIDDPDHSGEEERYVLLGLSFRGSILVVCHCYRRGEAIRIFSARKANPSERRRYEIRWLQ